MGITDSWIFSAHVVVGIMSDNRTSLPMLVPGFLCLCSAIVFGPVSVLLDGEGHELTHSDMPYCYTASKRLNELPPCQHLKRLPSLPRLKELLSPPSPKFLEHH